MSAALPRAGEGWPPWQGLLAFLLLSAVVWVLGGWVTSTSVGTWYPTLAKPSFNPPNWLFAPVWTTLYALMAVAAWRVWQIVGWRHLAIRLYLAQLALNLVWSFLFFGARSPLLGLVDIVPLWALIVATTLAFRRVHGPAALLMLPYVAWVGYALVLNAAIWWLN